MIKIVTRNGVFETNSSSTHSITISNKGNKGNLYVDEDGVCRIYPGEFGWEIESYNDSTTKASYCLTYLMQFDDNNLEINMLKDVVKEISGAKSVEFIPNDGYYAWGNIDHQSSDVASEAFESRENLKNFIQNSRSVLRTDNDNY